MPNNKLVHTFAKRLTAVSVIALMASGCASNERPYYSAYETGRYQNSNPYSNTSRPYDDSNRRDEFYGIDGAREAHRRYSEQRAEELDGNCETQVTIYRGETISDIAEYCDVPVRAIMAANRQIGDPRNISVGELLYIPAVHGNIYEGMPGYRDAPYRTSDRRDATYRLAYRSPDWRGEYAEANWVSRYDERDAYVIRPGDTFAEIAWRFDVPLYTIFELNPGMNPRRLQVGERIFLPDYAKTAPYDRAPRPYVHYGDKPPMISITPARGPRNGEIRVIGDNFKPGEQVTVLFGGDQNNLAKLKIVETNGDGRINEIVRLPDSFDNQEAYFAMQPRGRSDYIYSGEVYAINGNNNSLVSDARGGRLQDGMLDSNGATIQAMTDTAYWGDNVELRGAGFPPNTPVAIYGGPNRNSLEKISEVRTGPSGRFSADVEMPESSRRGVMVFVAAIEDGPRTIVSDQIRVLDRHGNQYGRYDGAALSEEYLDRNSKVTGGYNYRDDQGAIAPTSLDRGVGNQGGIFNRFRRSNDAYAIDSRSSAAGGVHSGGASSIVGILTGEGEKCPALRDDSGNLYTLLGDLEGFDDGDRVLIKAVRADDRICSQAATVQVYSIAAAPW